MATYVEYEMGDGQVLLVEVDDSDGSIVKVARDDGNIFIKTSTKFREAVRGAKSSATTLLEELTDLPFEAVEITFGLKSTGEAGLFAVSKIGVEANYQVTLKWKRPDEAQ